VFVKIAGNVKYLIFVKIAGNVKYLICMNGSCKVKKTVYAVNIDIKKSRMQVLHV